MTLFDLSMRIAEEKKSSLVLLAARPTMGKTSIAMGMALDLAKEGKKVNFISFSEKEAFMKQHMEFINSGALSEIQQENLNTIAALGKGIADIAQLCSNQPDVIFVDSMKELEKDTSIAEAEKALKEYSKTFACPVIVISSLTEKIDTRLFHKPRIKDLAASGLDVSIYDEVMLFFRKSHYSTKAPKDECCMVFKNGEESCKWSEITNCIK